MDQVRDNEKYAKTTGCYGLLPVKIECSGALVSIINRNLKMSLKAS